MNHIYHEKQPRKAAQAFVEKIISSKQLSAVDD